MAGGDSVLGMWRRGSAKRETLVKEKEREKRDSASSFRKDDVGKRKWHLLPHGAMDELLQAMEYGADKYGAYNWQKGTEWTRCYDAAMRHLESWLRQEHAGDRAPDSGIHHLGHLAANVFMLLGMIELGVGTDDRPPRKGKQG